MTRSGSAYRLSWGVLLGILLAGGTFPAGAAPAGFAGPLYRHPTNGRYFTDGSGKAIYLTGSHDWDTFQYWSSTADPAQYFNLLSANNHNFMRFWVADTAWSPMTNAVIEPQPYIRTGPGTAADGGLRFDLNRLNQSYFDQLRSVVVAARDRGIYVSLMLFDSWGISRYQFPPHSTTWNYHPFRLGNNVNGINGDPNNDGIGFEYHSLQIPAITRLQETYVRKLVDTVNDLDNVLYEISNEDDGAAAKDWQYYLIGYLRNYEASKAKQHPVGMTAITENGGARNDWLTGSTADWVSPQAGSYDSTSEPYNVNPPAADGGKVSLLDSDHLFYYNFQNNPALTRAWVWKSFTRGHNPILMEDLSASSGWIAARASMGHTRSYADRMDLAAMTPQNGLSSTAYCLASPGSEYLVYQPAGGAFTVTLSPGSYSYEWFNTGAGTAGGSGSITVNGSSSFTAPFSGEAALYLKRIPSTGGDLAGFWKLDEGSGTIAGDSSGNGNTGFLQGNPAWTAGGKVGGALSFNGVNQYLSIPASPSLNSLKGQMTLSLWVKMRANLAGRVLAGRRFGAGWDDLWVLYCNPTASAEYGFGVRGASSATAVGPASAGDLNAWVHLAGTYDGSRVRLYRNGIEVASAPLTGLIPDESTPLILGAGDNGNQGGFGEYSDCILDDVRLYNRALGVSEIQTLAGAGGNPADVYLSDLSWTYAVSGWGPIEKDMSNGESGSGDGRTITLNGVAYSKGLGAHAYSEIRYALGGRYSTFSSDVGVDDEVDGYPGVSASVVFQVWADGVKLWDSGVMNWTSATKTVNVSVAGKQELRLIVTDAGDNIWYDHADWAGAKLSTSSATGNYLSDLSWTYAVSGWGPIEKDMSNGENGAGDGRTMTLNGVAYAKGLGCHAYSEIRYTLGGQYATFTSDVGVDDEVDGNPGVSASITFQVWADGVKLWDSGVMNWTSATKTVNVSVAGKQELRLIVTDAGDNIWYDHADWAGARLIR